jgi:hypothetical protein
MTNKHLGWMLFAASIGMLCLLISADVQKLTSFDDIWKPAFVGTMLAHVGNVLMAFVGGKLIPTSPQDQRLDDHGKRS